MKSGQGVIQVLPLLIISLLLVTIGAFGKITYDGFNKQRIEPQPEPESTFKESLVTPTPTPKLNPTIKGTSNSNPIVTCSIHASCGGGSRQIKKSDCDNMNCCLIDSRCGGPKFITKTECNNSYCCLLKDGTAKLLSSKSACDNYYSNNKQGGTYYTPPSYPPCVIYYPASGYSQTYYVSPEQCQQWKNDVTSTTTQVNTPTPYATPTMSPEEIQALLDQIERDIAQCKNEVNSYYNQQVRNCSIQYGGSSAEEMCIYAQNKERDKKLKECEQ